MQRILRVAGLLSIQLTLVFVVSVQIAQRASAETPTPLPVEQRIALFWQRVNALGPTDFLAASDIGQWAQNLTDRDASAGISVADFRASTALMQEAFDRARIAPVASGTPDVEQRIALFWQRVNALGPSDRLAAADLGQWGLNVTARDGAAKLRVDDFRSDTATMQAAIDRAGHGDGPGTRTPVAPPSPEPAPLAISVSGNRLVDARGATVRLLGVNVSGQTTCTGADHDLNPGFFDGPWDDVSIAQMKAWHINAVRVQLNESCWLGINGSDPRYSGANYRAAIVDYTTRLHLRGIYVILDLSYNAPGANLARQSQPGPDADHAPDFWASVATTFRDDRAVLFDLINEPVQDSHIARGTDAWACWRDGCDAIDFADGTYGPSPNYEILFKPLRWRMAGMQQLVDVIRATGARHPMLLGGLNWANDLDGWLDHLPVDPANQIVASAHVYESNLVHTPEDWDRYYAPVAARYPLVTGEIGQDNTAHAFIDRYMAWADAHGVSYLGWAWGVFHPDPTQTGLPTGPTLILDYGDPQHPLIPNGMPPTPTVMGNSFRLHLLEVGYP